MGFFRVSLMVIFLSLNFCNFLTASSVISIKRQDNGGDKCDRALCVKMPGTYSSNSVDPNIFNLIVRINQTSPNQPFSFPWKIKAFDIENHFLGQSDEFDDSDFILMDNSNLKSTNSQVTIFQQRLFSTPLDSDCYIDNCGLEHSNIIIIFKLFSGETEIDNTCLSFNDPGLEVNSHVLVESLKTCECRIRETNRTANIQNYHYQNNTTLVNGVNVLGNNHEDQLVDHDIFFKVFPNPVSSKLTLDFSPYSSQNIQFDLISMNGRTVRKFFIENDQKIFHLDVSNFPNGIYIIRTFVNDESIIKRIIISN